MAIRVYGWKKPVLELELMEGGELLADTTYYIVGVYKYCSFTYAALSSPASDMYSITTTSTHKTIKVTSKTYNNIVNFQDNGDSRTLVTTEENHCHSTGDVINIETGSYIGSHAIEWVDYYNFIINTPYIDNVGVSCFSMSKQYGMSNYFYRSHNANASCYTLHMNTSPQIVDGKSVEFSNRWNNRIYGAGFENPSIMTKMYYESTSAIGNLGNAFIAGLDNGYMKDLKDTSSVFVEVDGADTYTLEDIHNACIEAGFPLVSTYKAGQFFSLYGSIGINPTYSTVRLVASDIPILMLFSEIYTGGADHIEFNRVAITYIPMLYSAYQQYTANDSFIYNNAGSNAFGPYQAGDNLITAASIRLGGNSDEASSFTDLTTGNVFNQGVCKNKIFRTVTSKQSLQVSYSGTRFENCVISQSIYWVCNNLGADYSQPFEPDRYMSSNTVINSQEYLPNHFRVFCYSQHSLQILRFLNIDTNDVDNIKWICNNRAADLDFMFYRRLNFIVGDGINSISNASITITETTTNITYTGTTGTEGNVYIDVMEQLTTRRYEDGTTADSIHHPQFNTLYTNFNIVVEKSGYETYELNYNLIKGENLIAIDLKPQIPLLIPVGGGSPVLKLNPENYGNDRDLGTILMNNP